MGDSNGSTPEAKLTMNVAIGPGDPMRAKPARAGGASLACAAIDTFCASRVKPHLGTVFDYAAVWTLERSKLRP